MRPWERVEWQLGRLTGTYRSVGDGSVEMGPHGVLAQALILIGRKLGLNDDRVLPEFCEDDVVVVLGSHGERDRRGIVRKVSLDDDLVVAYDVEADGEMLRIRDGGLMAVFNLEEADD